VQIERTVFFISDGTGITAGALGQLLAHFPQTHFKQVRLPFTDNETKIEDAKQRFLAAKMGDGMRPVVIMSLGNVEHRALIKEADAYFIDLFNTFIDPLGVELAQEPLTGKGIAHGIMGANYHERMEAINFTLGQ
jgi:[pyruvate, water dikinase]-phosphate phosphotransferase / [pyruvate, water dikinase] kinase